MTVRHFLTLLDFSPAELQTVITRSMAMKAAHYAGQDSQIFRNKVLGMIFEKSSTRTRVSFEAGMAQLGGHALFLSPRDTQLGRGEPVEDSARVLSRMVDIIMIRTFAHDLVERFAQYSRVPVINALTDDFHPCQVLADIQTYIEQRGDISGRSVILRRARISIRARWRADARDAGVSGCGADQSGPLAAIPKETPHRGTAAQRWSLDRRTPVIASRVSSAPA